MPDGELTAHHWSWIDLFCGTDDAPSAAPPAPSPPAPDPAEIAARQAFTKDRVTGDATTKPADMALVNDEIVKKVPAKELAAIKAAGIHVRVTTGGVATYMPSLNTSPARGHPPGDTFSKIPGVYVPNTKEVIIATHAAANGARELPGQNESSSDDVVAHEMAHAYNVTAGGGALMSDSQEFKDAYKEATTGHLGNAYYHQTTAQGGDSSGGRDEGFAESNAMYRTNPETMKKTYPKLYAYWHKKLGN